MTPWSIQPDPDEARRLLIRELAHPEYNRENLMQKAIDWILRKWGELVAVTSASSLASVIAALVIAGVLVAALLWLLSRARVTASAGRDSALLPEQRVPASEHRRLAEAAMAAGDYETAVVEGFRALALREIERGRIDDHPEATAQETTRALVEAFPGERDRLHEIGLIFDLVLYGERPATVEQARAVLDFDLAGAR